eukprot:NODE_5567_length_1756_cov_9.419276.p1 GENE.NODE_5567_length_1756_cov_9.419276~~NODE_5567_length_1756_cov_9.419276.p1  ORF type:complete len:481 (+),score=144.34 NODE_5567_length_1756_cov_9.419276:172-1614(+)
MAPLLDRVIDGTAVVPPQGARRWWPQAQKLSSRSVRQEVRGLVKQGMMQTEHCFSCWQMPFPCELENGDFCPVSMLGECGDPACSTYRPKVPEVREAIEATVKDHCVEHFASKGRQLETYVSVGCGLMAQDWIVLERLRKVGVRPSRVVFVELRAAQPVVALEASSSGQAMDLKRMGWNGLFGPEFSFAALVSFGNVTHPSTIFSFTCDFGDNGVSLKLAGPERPGVLLVTVTDGMEPHTFDVEPAYVMGETHSIFLSISSMGTVRMFVDGRHVGRAQVPCLLPMVRRQLFIGGDPDDVDQTFVGQITKIKVWDQEVDSDSASGLFLTEFAYAAQQFANWFAKDMALWTFGSLGVYARACEEDPRFAADLLVRIDVHDEMDGYDDLACKSLKLDGFALTLGGEGHSWRRNEDGCEEIHLKCKQLEIAEIGTKFHQVTQPCTGMPHFHFFTAAGMEPRGKFQVHRRKCPPKATAAAHSSPG